MDLFCRIISLKNAAKFPFFCRNLSEALIRLIIPPQIVIHRLLAYPIQENKQNHMKPLSPDETLVYYNLNERY